ncbi:MAG: hypothetical protein H5U36_09215 [Candidatus Caldatribacterium sp.]|nr:hypothetical protein [Candidatus Caldatribacterium sp.]
MRYFLFSLTILLALSGILAAGCEDGEIAPRISEYAEGETTYTGTVTSSWSQSISVSSTTVVTCINGECEVYHSEEIR